MVHNGTSGGDGRLPLIGFPTPPAAPIQRTLGVATPLVVKALEESYPAWTDEHGTNVEQLAAIAVAVLYEHHLLVVLEPTSVRRGIDRRGDLWGPSAPSSPPPWQARPGASH